jgi:hypothetical protein
MANKITFDTVEKLFFAKYPAGVIWQTTATNKSKYSISIAFTTGGKCYNYIVSNYKQLINKLQLAKMIYQYEYEINTRRINELKLDIERGYIDYNDLEFFGFISDDYVRQYTSEEIQQMQLELDHLINENATSIII